MVVLIGPPVWLTVDGGNYHLRMPFPVQRAFGARNAARSRSPWPLSRRGDAPSHKLKKNKELFARTPPLAPPHPPPTPPPPLAAFSRAFGYVPPPPLPRIPLRLK